MVLALLVLFVLLVVVFQVFLTSEVELEQAALRVERSRWWHLADACAQQARSALVVDLEDAADEEGEDGGAAAGGDVFAGGGEGSADGALGGSSAEVAGSTDSALDEWAQSANVVPALGEGLTLYVEVVDEDSKLNLLGLYTEDEDVAQEWRDIFITLFDEAFEGTSRDLSYADAHDILDGLDDWVKGERKSLSRKELPEQKLTDAQDQEASEVDTDIIEDKEFIHYPFTLDELLLFEGLRPEHLDGFVEDDEYFPGLREAITLWSHLELKDPPPEDEDDPFSGSPLGGGDEAAEDTAAEDQALIQSAQTSNDGKVNCNTAPLIVLRALAPEDIPTSFLERVIEFRELMHEVRDELIESEGFDWDQPDEDEAEGGGADDESDLDEDDPAYYVFSDTAEVFDKVEGKWDLSVFTDEEEKELFLGRLTTVSEVFTIKILVLDAEAGRRATYRTVVWRIDDEDQPRCVTLEPLHEYHDSRRPEDYPEDLADDSQDRFSRRNLR